MHETAAPLITGEDPGRISAIARSLTGSVGWGGSGAETRGRSAIDIALWDLLGQTAGLPLFALLGWVSPHLGERLQHLRGLSLCTDGRVADGGQLGTSRSWRRHRPVRGPRRLPHPARRAGREPARAGDPGHEDLAVRRVRRDDRRHLRGFGRPRSRTAPAARDPRRGRHGDGRDDRAARPLAARTGAAHRDGVRCVRAALVRGSTPCRRRRRPRQAGRSHTDAAGRGRDRRRPCALPAPVRARRRRDRRVRRRLVRRPERGAQDRGRRRGPRASRLQPTTARGLSASRWGRTCRWRSPTQRSRNPFAPTIRRGTRSSSRAYRRSRTASSVRLTHRVTVCACGQTS